MLLLLRMLGRGRRHHGGIACDDIVSGVGEERDHFTAHGLVYKLVEGGSVELVQGQLPQRHGEAVRCVSVMPSSNGKGRRPVLLLQPPV